MTLCPKNYRTIKDKIMKIKKDLQTILVIIIGFLILYAIFRWKGFWMIAAGVGIPGLLIPPLRSYIVRAWHGIAEVLGFINSRIILSLIFFLILFPIALLSRLFSKDRFQLNKKGKGKGTYYKERAYKYVPGDFENPW